MILIKFTDSRGVLFGSSPFESAVNELHVMADLQAYVAPAGFPSRIEVWKDLKKRFSDDRKTLVQLLLTQSVQEYPGKFKQAHMLNDSMPKNEVRNKTVKI
ncbi:MAG TPA: hypothetical protein VM577_11230 [Anaerovoracaceae bacterium]|nr:hypothetical protein [Anaerovoracaceae bacterium]